MKNFKVVIMLPIVFLLCGFFSVFAVEIKYATTIMQFIYGVIVLIWGFTVNKRITDNVVRRLLLCAVGFLELYFLLQMCKYCLFTENATIMRYCWYAYYIPINSIPLILFLVAYYMNMQEDESPNKKIWLLFIPCIIIIIGFLTNDLHGLAFRSPSGPPTGSWDYTYGILYFISWIYSLSLLLASIFVMIKKCSVAASKKYIWLPILPLGLSIAYFVCYAFGCVPSIAGDLIWEIGEMYGFMTIGFFENCIQIGIIPANTGYEKLFRLNNIPAVIKDANGKTVYSTQNALDVLRVDENTQIHSNSISGGRIEFAVDISAINELNKKLNETTEQIKTRNEYLKTQNALKEEQSAVSARNEVYDKISEIVSPQTLKINAILDDITEENAKKQLAEICVYDAYIKRRSNLELLRSEFDTLNISELVTAMAESLEYLKLCDKQTYITNSCEGDIATNDLILIYEFFENVIENVICEINEMSVITDTLEKQFSIRIIMDTDNFVLKNPICSPSITTDIISDDKDTVILLKLQKGGDDL